MTSATPNGDRNRDRPDYGERIDADVQPAGEPGPSAPAPEHTPTATPRSPLVRVIAALAIVLILVALWVLTWAVVSGALTSDDGPFGDRAASADSPGTETLSILRDPS
jgi:nitrogen fixation-related uncharacterized protein